MNICWECKHHENVAETGALTALVNNMCTYKQKPKMQDPVSGVWYCPYPTLCGDKNKAGDCSDFERGVPFLERMKK